MSSLADSEKKLLLQIARRALVAGVERRAPDDAAQDAGLRWPGGAFVTITRAGRLRGCIGQLPSGVAIIDVVAYCARAVASDDPRFPRVTPGELAEIEIEISALSPLSDINPEAIEPGKHGLFVSNGARRGILLPQVAVQFRWNGIRLLEATCEKAGLPRDAWKNPATRVQAFTAEVFAEAEFREA
ncbi:MAG TPA: AmmeMemoRadiSam system protein A [Candidatus Aquilonibacter sp.]|nr:AmmeMemoRadiSam system protein A [Candidatus Aquilonibacter sp.]